MIQVTAAAQAELLRLGLRAGLSRPEVHLGIRVGGCLGQIYTLEIRAASPSLDSTLQVSIAPSASPYLSRLTLDYGEDLMGGNFRFMNPAATQSCSCGQSFAIDSASDEPKTQKIRPPKD